MFITSSKVSGSIEFIRCIVAGGNPRVGVDHDGFIAHFAKGFDGMNAGVVELYTLSNSIGAGAQYDYTLFGLANFVVIGVAG